MAGTNVVNNLQLGDSSIPTRNFVWQTNNDGSAKLARGNVGATTQDILTVDQNGRIAFPQSVVAFYAYQTVAQSLPNGANPKLLFQIEDFDIGGGYDPATSRFQPTVAGYYSVGGGYTIATQSTQLILNLFKNEANIRTLAYTTQAAGVFGSTLVYMNGSSDYLDLRATQYTTAQNTVAAIFATYFSGYLVAKA